MTAALTEAQVGELLELTQQADSVELKLTIAEPHQCSALHALGIDPLDRRRLVTELWLYPDDSRILELSTRCAPTELFDVAAETRAFLAACDVDTSGEQH